MEQLSGLDAMFVHSELHGLPMHISSFSIYDPSTAPGARTEFRHVLDLFEHKIQHEVPALRQRLVEVPLNLDQPYWAEDPHFDMVYHVRHIALPKPADWNKLFTLIANLHALPLNRARPLWEAYVIDGLDHLEGIPKGCFGLFLKVHHAIMDGRTGMALYSHLHTLAPEVQQFPPAQPLRRLDADDAPGVGRLLAQASLHNARKTLGLGQTLLKVAKTVSRVHLRLRAGELHSLDKPKTRFNAPISPGRVVDRQRLPIGDIKVIRQTAGGATVNDVALAIIGGALRRYLSSKSELPVQSLVAGVPIDVRRAEDAHVRGNMVSLMNVALCSDIEDPLQRVLAVHREAVASKAYADTLGRTAVNEIFDGLYSGLTSWGIRSVVESGAMALFAPVHNTIVTNVPGAPMPIYLAGARMIDSFGMGPLVPSTGLFHTVTSTYEYLNVAFVACRDMMPDPEFYSQCIGDSFEELRDAALEERARQVAAAQDEGRKAGRRTAPRVRRVHPARADQPPPVQKARRQRGAPPASAAADEPMPAGLAVVADNTRSTR